MTEDQKRNKAATDEIISAMVDYVCEMAEQSDRGYAIEGDMYAALMTVMPNLTSEEFRKLKLLAFATGRVKKGSITFTVEPV